MKYYIYNSKANNGIRPAFPDGVEPVDALGLDYGEFFAGLAPEDEVVLVGGDGTVNYFINAVDTDALPCKVYWLSAGTGNDLLRDLEGQPGTEIPINDLVRGLPTVYVNGLERKFINGIGYGIDGYCCEVADQIKAKEPNKQINYSGIAIKGLLFHFKPRHASLCVDGQRFEYDDAWIAATMKGRFYGGGLMIAPAQDRKSGKVTCVVYKSKSNLKALMSFPNISKGTHVANTDMVKIHEGHEVDVAFDVPCALQIDGETVLNVSSYRVKA